MELKSSIFLTFFLPTTLTSIIILVTIYYLIYNFMDDYTKTMENYMIQDAQQNINLIVKAIQQKIQQEYQSVVIYMTALNFLINKISQYPTTLPNSNYAAQPLGEYNIDQYKQFMQQHPHYNITNLKFYTSSFYNSNVSTLSSLSADDQNFLYYKKHADALTYAIIKFPGIELINIVGTYIISINSGTTYDYPDDIDIYSDYLNSGSSSSINSSVDCNNRQNTYPFDYRCSTWYKKTISRDNNTLVFIPPYLDSMSKLIINTVCVKNFDNLSITCFDFNINSKIFNQNDINNQSSYYYLIFPGTRDPIVYPQINQTEIQTIDYYEFVNTTTSNRDQEYFYNQTNLFKTTYTGTGCDEKLIQDENDTQTILYSKDMENYYLFIKNITICQKIVNKDYIDGTAKKSLVYQDTQTDTSAYLAYVMQENAILSGVINIQNQISLILVIDQMIIILIILIMVYQVFKFTFALSNQITQPVDHLIACLRKIQGDDLEKVYESLSENLVAVEFSKKKKRKEKSKSKRFNQYDTLQQISSSSSSSGSSSSSTSDDEDYDDTITHQERTRLKLLKKKIKHESNKIKKQRKEEQQNDISSDLICFYRVLYEIVHVIKEANLNFLEGNEEQALMTYAKSIDFFSALQNENAVSICLNNMGNVYMKQKQYIQASEKYQESLHFVKTQREKLRELYKKHVSERVLHTDEQYRYYSSLFITRSFHLAEALLEAIQQKQYDAMKFLGLFSEEECYTAIKQKYEAIKQNIKIFNPARNAFDPMIAHVLLQLAFCSIELGKKSDAIMYLEEAEDEIKKENNPNYPFHLTIPREILLQRVLYLKGYLNIKINQLYIGSIFLTKSIEHGKIYCPKFRMKALLHLKSLFDMIEENKQYSAFSGVNYLLEKYKPLIKDVLFLSNISASMGSREKILVSSQTILTIFQKYISKSFDRVGYYLFNESVREIFRLQRVEKSWNFLDNMLQNMPTVSGRGSISNALNEAFRIFDENQYYAHSLHMKKVDLTYKKFVILFTDEADILQEGKSIKKQWQKIKENFRFSNIILVIYAFTDNHEVMKIFKELVDYCQDGFVIHYKEYKTIHSYFQNLTETFLENSYEIETIS